MAVTNGWGQAAVNNTIDYGKGKTTATNDWGKIYDSSASGDTSLGTATTFPNTKSILLDGVDDFVDCGDNNNLSFGDGSNDSPFSISLWVKLSGTNFIEAALSKYGISSKREYIVYIVNQKVRLLIIDASATAHRLVETSNAISVGSWVNIVCVYNGVGGNNAENGIKIYINGSLSSTTSSKGGTYVAMENTSQPFQIGRYFNGAQYFAGNMDEVAVFNSELSLSDVTAIYNSGVPASLSSYSSLVSWWRCGDNDTSPTLTDNGSGGNNGTMTNFTAFSTDVPT